MVLTPGQYLALRRKAAGLTIEDVALRLDTAPPVSARTRGEWLALIEADEMPIGPTTVDALHGAFAFDGFILFRLDELRRGVDKPEPQLCRACACSWDDACVDDAGVCCSWVRPDLCSACHDRDRDAAVQATPANDPVPREHLIDRHARRVGVAR